ncbi:hypothetical protein F5Y14DRAFT_428323 [Nemania sp. NC0429]|nr:hypothetical protein F5Y14DRAFT_428323 [Nemania sp. NC0429]
MSADSLPTTLSFLTDAAHLLALASPETSAHLMSRRNLLMFDSGLDQNDVQRQHVCGCCGHIMIAGHGDSFKMDSGKMARRKKTKTATGKNKKIQEGPPRTGCRKKLTCGKCGRYTRIRLPPPAPISRRRPNQISKPTMSAGVPIKMTTTTAMTTTMIPAKTTISTSTTAKATAARSISSSGPSSTPGAAASTSANANSKKRAKSRKQGLQALLQQSTSSKPQAGLGLSLADFMQN